MTRMVGAEFSRTSESLWLTRSVICSMIGLRANRVGRRRVGRATRERLWRERGALRADGAERSAGATPPHPASSSSVTKCDVAPITCAEAGGRKPHRQ